MKRELRYNPLLPGIRDDIKGYVCLDNEFIFGSEKDKLPFDNLFKWMITPNPQRKEKKLDRFIPEVIYNKKFLELNSNKIVWLGHSSFYIQLDGIRILTDPVFHHLTPLLRRKHDLPCSIDHFKNIDYILLSHGQRDHLDIPTLKTLAQLNPSVEILCPLGFDKMMKRIGFQHIQEAAWWQQYKIQKLDIVFLPAKHWNRRFITDYNTTLWGSFSISNGLTNIYFAGDTGHGHHFKEISKYLPSFDVCIMPVGAYKPTYVMEWAHTSPEEALQGFHELNGKTFIPMHYGTFDLSDEPASEPKKILQALNEQDLIKGVLKLLKVGEEFILHHN